MSIWKRKPLSQLLNEASESEKGLKKTLTAPGLVALGIGAIIGAGLFSITGLAASMNAIRIHLQPWVSSSLGLSVGIWFLNML